MNKYFYTKLEPVRNLILRYLGLPKKNQLYGLKHLEILNANVKQLSQEIANLKLQKSNNKFSDDYILKKYNLSSKVCTQKDCESEWFKFWCNKLHFEPLYLRKLWEYAIILQILFERNYLKENNKVLAFGCGSEPLPSYFASLKMEVLATDLDPSENQSKDWLNRNQLLKNKDNIYKNELVNYEQFNKYVDIKFVNMNNIPKFDKLFDIAYSICSLEHIGSIEKGLSFIENSLNSLKSGGISIHTTEYNYEEEEKTLDNLPTVLFLKKHFIELKNRLENKGHTVLNLNFDVGNELFDNYIDLPPFYLSNNKSEFVQHPHLKLLLEQYKSTCFCFVVVKN